MLKNEVKSSIETHHVGKINLTKDGVIYLPRRSVINLPRDLSASKIRSGSEKNVNIKKIEEKKHECGGNPVQSNAGILISGGRLYVVGISNGMHRIFASSLNYEQSVAITGINELNVYVTDADISEMIESGRVKAVSMAELREAYDFSQRSRFAKLLGVFSSMHTS